MKTLLAFLRRADEGTLSRLTVEATILLAASRHNGADILKDAATLYKVDINWSSARKPARNSQHGEGEERCQTSCEDDVQGRESGLASEGVGDELAVSPFSSRKNA